MNIKIIRLHKLYKVFLGSIELHCVRKNMTHHRVHYDCFQIAKNIIKCKRWNVPTPNPSWGSPPYFKRPFGRQFLFQKWKKTYQWSQLGKIDPKRLTENGVNLKVMWERWQIVYKTICTAINQFKKKQAISQLLWGQQNSIRSQKEKPSLKTDTAIVFKISLPQSISVSS